VLFLLSCLCAFGWWIFVACRRASSYGRCSRGWLGSAGGLRRARACGG